MGVEVVVVEVDWRTLVEIGYCVGGREEHGSFRG